MKRWLLPISVLFVSAIAHADQVDWKYDAMHSHVRFSVAHLGISSIDGTFNEVAGKLTVADEKDLTKSQINVVIKAASIDTNQAKRDEHLKSADFFDVGKFPDIVFSSTKITRDGKGFNVNGTLTLHGVTKAETFKATLTPVVSDGGREMRAGTLTGKIKRADYGLNFNKALDRGGVVIGEEVTLDVKAEFSK